MYDINLFPIKIHQGQQTIVSNGFKASAPPRRAVRSRAEDLLILSLSMNGHDSVLSEIKQNWVDNLMQSFFKTSGSVTSAMRSLIETLNLTLLEKNLKLGRDVGPTTAAINLAAIHRRVIYIVQCGLSHAFVLNRGGLGHYYDSSQTDRGLGFSRSPNIRYYQADIGQGSYFFTTTAPPTTWTEEDIFSGGFPTLEQLRRRLSNQAPQDMRIDLAQILPGDGQIYLQQPQKQEPQIERKKPAEIETDSSLGQQPQAFEDEDPAAFDTREINAEAVKLEEKEEESDDILASQTEVGPYEEVGTESPSLAEIKENVIEDVTHPEPVEKPEPAPPTEESVNEEKREKLIADSEKIKERSINGLSAFLNQWRSFREKIGSFFRDFVNRWTPFNVSGSSRMSKGTSLVIAIVVPLILVAIAAGIYFSRGRTLQYQRYFEQAQLSATTAMEAENPNQSREAWYRTMDYLEQAASYKQTDQVAELRTQAQDAIDALDGAVRLAYQPAIIGSLYSEINITDIISYGPDLYLLDSAGGRVIHAERMSQGYEIDPDFVCAAGNYSGGRIESIVDMVSLPLNNAYQAHILAVDALGNAAYCAPGQNPVVQSLPSVGGVSGDISSIAYDSNYLYVLIPSSSSILVYRPTNGQFLDVPTNFFEDMDFNEIPNLNQVTDIAVNGPELYLLKGDGNLIDCSTSGLAGNPVTCEDPVTFIDGRPGKEDQIFTMPSSYYSAIQHMTPPDPSLNILDANNGDIYRFSLRFRLYERLRPEMGDFEVESTTATAFTIGIDRIAFLAFGHQVFYAYVE